ncbi:TPA: tetratricopeptide repeat protein [Providencia rettgeri]|nr:tetratricopeptide repeat protein [Providencia rettgeri]
MNIQKQTSGDHSTNIQAAGDVHLGISEKNLEEILGRVISPNNDNISKIITLIEIGKTSQAQEQIDRLVEAKISILAEELVDLATLQSLINIDKSNVILEKALMLSPNKPRVLNVYALAQMDKGRTDEAEKIFIKALEVSDDDDIKEQIIGNLGVLYKNSGRYKEAIDNLELAIEFAKKSNQNIGLVKHLNNLGACYHNIGMQDDAITKLEESLTKINVLIDSSDEKEKKKNLKSVQASVFTNIAITLKNKYRNSNNTDFLKQSISYLERAIDIEESLDNIGLLGRHFGNLAESYRLLGDRENHEKFIKKSFSAFKKYGTQKDKLTSEMNMGLFFSHYDNHPEALMYFTNLLSNPDLKKFPKLNVLTLINTSHSYIQSNQKYRSKDLIREAHELSLMHNLKYEAEYIESNLTII